MRKYKNIAMWLLVLLAAFIGFQYLAALKEKGRLAASLRQANQRVSSLQEERQALLADLNKEKDRVHLMRENLKADSRRMSEVRESLKELNYKFSLLKAENLSLRNRYISLREQAGQIAQERDMLIARMNSLEELRKAIRELKQRMHKVRRQVREIVLEGNRGFITRDGRPTNVKRVRIEVISVSEAGKPPVSSGKN